jgi:hypothetical protein
VGDVGMRLLARIDAPHTPEGLKRLAEIEVLRKGLEQRYGVQIDGEWWYVTQERCLKPPTASNPPTRWRPATPPSEG